MNSYLTYIIEANICLLIFGLFYQLVLRKETNFKFLRLYLVLSTAIALAIPSIDLSGVYAIDNPISVNEFQAFELEPLVVVGMDNPQVELSARQSSFSWIQALGYAYFTGIIVLSTIFLFQLYQIVHLLTLRKIEVKKRKGYYYIPTHGQLPTFSFLNLLFFDNTEELSTAEKQKIIEHEVAHISSLHTLDIIFLEITRIIFWINPVVWFNKTNMQQVHEFLADQHMIQHNDKEEYSSLLAKMTLKKMSLSIGHHFNKSMTLKRIKMMKSPKSNIKRWKLSSAILLPLILFVAFSCNDEVMNEMMETTSQVEVPAELQQNMASLQESYPDAKFVYLETDVENKDKLDQLKDIDPNSIAHVHVWKDRKTIGLIVNQNGPLNKVVKNSDDNVFNIVEQPAKPVNGFDALYKGLSSQLTYPEEAKNNQVEGKVYVQFVVDTDGSLENIEVIRGLGYGLDEVALAAVNSLDDFIPAEQRGKKVRQRIILPILFSLGEGEAKASTDSHIEMENSFKVQASKEGDTIKGKVINDQGKNMPGVNIIIKGTTSGTVTNLNGEFEIKVDDSNAVLIMSFVGYSTKRIAVKDL